MGRVSKPKRSSKSAPAVRRSDSPPQMEALVQELFNVATDTATHLGATPEQCQRGAERAAQSTSRERPSESVIKNDVGLSNLLGKWRQHFAAANGAPKVLPVKGKGGSLEALAKEFLPDLPLKDVLALLVERAEVARMKGNKIALVGNPANIVGERPASALAWCITSMRHLASTHVHNYALPLEERSKGRLDRMIYVPLGLAEFEKFAKAARPQLQEVSNSIEKKLEALDNGQSGDDKVLCGLAIQIFRNDKKIG